jgi:hypothetical protein
MWQYKTYVFFVQTDKHAHFVRTASLNRSRWNLNPGCEPLYPNSGISEPCAQHKERDLGIFPLFESESLSKFHLICSAPSKKIEPAGGGSGGARGGG